MKYLIVYTVLNIILLSLSACDSGTEIAQKLKDISSQANKTPEDSLVKSPPKTSEQEIERIQASASDLNNEFSQEQNEPLTLTDFRNAINTVVQDSVQEQVEKAVENEIAKNK